MNLHLISGFLGSGKTTAIQTACKALMEQGLSVGVITNDQGIKLVDTGFFESHSIPNRQVINGCFCCNYNALDKNIQSLIQTNNPEVIFAESVGSCTDIVATVMKPLLQFRKDVTVTVSTFADVRLLQMLFVEKKNLFNKEVQYIYTKQLEEAGVIVVSKIDLVNEETLNSVQRFLQDQYPGRKIIYINGTSDESTTQWLNVITNRTNHFIPSSLDIDYSIYGAGEAMLAWLDAELKIESDINDAQQTAIQLAQLIYNTIQKEGLTIGHLKFLIDNTIKISYTASEDDSALNEIYNSGSSSILINARIQTTPAFLSSLIHEAVQQTEKENNCVIVKEGFASFRPGYPTPTHRITV
ncbi:GTP-binding protein [Parafilimonas sp.]|uniref:GTP-binding protein n=1 Tax=Parafilimonas sp. TaxID=1969739 RepID=UPI0039E48938